MKRLLVVITIAAALWSGYWVIATQGAKAGFESWFEARRADGWQADYAKLEIKGFPNRIDSTFEAPMLADPGSGLAWEAPFFQIFALTYKPNHIIAVWPKTQRFSTPQAKYDIASENMRASLVMAPEAKLPLDRANLVAEAMAVTTGRETTTLDGLQLSVSRLEGAAQEYRLAINADGIMPPLPANITLRTSGKLPRQLDAFRADLSVKFNRPWDLRALEERRPQPSRIKLKLAEAKWGALELALAGTLDIDENGRPSGRLTVKARNWRDIIVIVRQMGWVPENWLGHIEQALTLAAQLSGNIETLDLSLDFKDGTMAFGPIPLGPAPLIRLR
jgi:hypothetical protein